ncbi:MAG: hypothetical protein AAF950_18685 [Pseudomonadota bacterium]
MLAKIIGLFLASIMIAVVAIVMFPFTMYYAAAAAKTDPVAGGFAGVVILVLGLFGFVSWARSILTDFISDEAQENGNSA